MRDALCRACLRAALVRRLARISGRAADEKDALMGASTVLSWYLHKSTHFLPNRLFSEMDGKGAQRS